MKTLPKKMFALDLAETKTVRPFNDETEFIIGALDSFLRSKIDDAQAQYSFSTDKEDDNEADMQVNRHQRNIEIVRYGLKGWNNFKTASGKEIKFDTVADARYSRTRNIVSEECIRVMPVELIDWLAEQIMSFNTLSEQAEKNS